MGSLCIGSDLHAHVFLGGRGEKGERGTGGKGEICHTLILRFRAENHFYIMLHELKKLVRETVETKEN